MPDSGGLHPRCSEELEKAKKAPRGAILIRDLELVLNVAVTSKLPGISR